MIYKAGIVVIALICIGVAILGYLDRQGVCGEGYPIGSHESNSGLDGVMLALKPGAEGSVATVDHSCPSGWRWKRP